MARQYVTASGSRETATAGLPKGCNNPRDEDAERTETNAAEVTPTIRDAIRESCQCVCTPVLARNDNSGHGEPGQ